MCSPTMKTRSIIQRQAQSLSKTREANDAIDYEMEGAQIADHLMDN